MTVNQQKLDALVGRLFGDLSAGYGGVMVEPRRQARPLQGDGRRRPAQLAGGRQAQRLRRALCARVAQLAGRGRLCRLSPNLGRPTS